MHRSIALLALCPMLASPWAFAGEGDPEESLSFAYAYTDDGGCEDATHAVTGDYRGSFGAIGLDVAAYAKVAPSGGDCRTDGLAYRMSMDKGFALGESDWSATARFLADSRSTAAPYALMDETGSQVLTRSDGNALLVESLPAGQAETVVAALGVTRAFGDGESPVKVTFAANIVPVEWSDGTSTQTIHAAVDAPIPVPRDGWWKGSSLSLSASADAAEAGSFGSATLRFARGPLFLALRHAFGLNALDGGEPSEQEIAGVHWALQGAPRGGSTTLEAGIRL